MVELVQILHHIFVCNVRHLIAQILKISDLLQNSSIDNSVCSYEFNSIKSYHAWSSMWRPVIRDPSQIRISECTAAVLYSDLQAAFRVRYDNSLVVSK